MAKADLGTKRTCPETGKNFYDLNKDPIVSPYTEIEYPLSFFETATKPTKAKRGAAKPDDPEAEDEEDEIEDEAETGADAETEDEDEDEEKALELGDDADEVVLDGGDDDDDGDTSPANVPAGFTEEGVDDTEEDGVLLDDDDDEFDIEVDDDIDLDADISEVGDEDKT